MGEKKNLCLMAVDIIGAASLDAAIGALEAKHAVDRAMRRVDLAVEANRGEVANRNDIRVCASFERPELAMLAACEILDRIRNLPPLAGKRLGTRIGIHYGEVDGQTSVWESEACNIAGRLMRAAKGNEALASAAGVMLLPPSLRHLAEPESETRADLLALGFPVYSVGRNSSAVMSIPPATRIGNRMTIRYRNKTIMLDEHRPVLLLGREMANDIVIVDPRASRQHCRIEYRQGGFTLIDYSSNGCYVLEDGSEERRIRQGETAIVGPGRIGCGFSAHDTDGDQVLFELT